MFKLLEVKESNVSDKVLDDVLMMLLDDIVGHFTRWNIGIDHNQRDLDVRLYTRNLNQNRKPSLM